jgi:hypothetical protein
MQSSPDCKADLNPTPAPASRRSTKYPGAVFFELFKNGMLGGNQNMWMIEKVASILFFERFNLASILVLLVVLFVLFGTYGNQFFFLWPCYRTWVLNFEKYLATMHVQEVDFLHTNFIV